MRRRSAFRAVAAPTARSLDGGGAGRLPSLALVADYSHFLAACEVDPGDEMLEEAILSLIPHIAHLHARVGYDNGPQATDPRLALWDQHLQGHLRWWRAIWAAQRAAGCETACVFFARGTRPVLVRPLLRQSADSVPCLGRVEVSTFTPEHGPWPYQHVFPRQGARRTARHVADVNAFMLHRCREEFGRSTA